MRPRENAEQCVINKALPSTMDVVEDANDEADGEVAPVTTHSNAPTILKAMPLNCDTTNITCLSSTAMR